jgi:hypothetical protein
MGTDELNSSEFMNSSRYLGLLGSSGICHDRNSLISGICSSSSSDSWSISGMLLHETPLQLAHIIEHLKPTFLQPHAAPTSFFTFT